MSHAVLALAVLALIVAAGWLVSRRVWPWGPLPALSRVGAGLGFDVAAVERLPPVSGFGKAETVMDGEHVHAASGGIGRLVGTALGVVVLTVLAAPLIGVVLHVAEIVLAVVGALVLAAGGGAVWWRLRRRPAPAPVQAVPVRGRVLGRQQAALPAPEVHHHWHVDSAEQAAEIMRGRMAP